jgi:S-adenosylmethionine hydrolase
MSNNKQQTALEWFIEELEYKGDLRETPSIRNIQLNIDTSDYMELKVQAKEMEKEQIKKAVNFGDERGNIVSYSTAEQYYNETYGGGEQ